MRLKLLKKAIAIVETKITFENHRYISFYNWIAHNKYSLNIDLGLNFVAIAD
jgi:hypothetical protein